MNRLSNRLVVATAALAAGGLLLTGCGSGQISQTAGQEAAINGSTGNVKNIALRNVHLQAVQKGDALKPGRTVELIFVAANNSPDVNDKLVGISTDVGSVDVSGPTAIPANSRLVVGTPDGQDEVEALSSAQPTSAEVTLSQPISNGLTYTFKFDFEKAGEVSVAVPISAGNAPRQDEVGAGGGHG
ncbi:putative lipoprotein LpqE [Mycolicibacterium anyangense]|uniref:Putative lipoprotein LpqE n=1 Tax=Mycolicibacterium anyangense TaxID=1431246 RepID=A0A6N4W7M6_9MYCO|nr:hypothetical protein [Mycolicibacterium anyangense]BBZ77990.1 putative lipoprotein LpqE [Mycolicibacterium anyangense]